MPLSFSQRLDLATAPAIALGPQHICRGIEKESLRITEHGRLAQTPHPDRLGSALTNEFITTDYSEALLEFITPVYRDVDTLLECLDDIHRFVYHELDNELLWTASMPCVLNGNEAIPVARYGSSNIGAMKTIYRLGLGHRYGRAMQTIAGIHFNFSLEDKFWQGFQRQLGAQGDLQAFKNEQYLGMIRNFRRYSWLLIYLFGASPALCRSFLGSAPHSLQTLADNTLYLPYATALRMGKLGYQSSAQEDLLVSYDSLDEYVSSLQALLTRKHPAYEAIGTHDSAGNWQQLSTALLQIENEFYSSIRPKQPIESGEAPLRALIERGIEYIEIRALDVNPFLPAGIGADEVRFLDLFLLYCLLQPSPPLDAEEYQQSQKNLALVVDRGRAPGLTLEACDGPQALNSWATEILSGLAQLVQRFSDPDDHYRRTLAVQQAKIDDSALTPSGRILQSLEDNHTAWFHFALNQSQSMAEHFRQRPLDLDKQRAFTQAATASLERQRKHDEQQEPPFSDFLAAYYEQYR